MSIENVVLKLLKLMGLGLSASLTVALFSELFWSTPYGAFIVVCALALFEGGALGWNYLLGHAKGFQRTVVFGAMWFCVFVSVVSSAVEIIMITKLFTATGFDLGFWTLVLIAGALAVNVCAAMGYEYFEPSSLRRHQQANDETASQMAAHNKLTHIRREAEAMAEQQLNARMPEIAKRLADRMVEDVVQAAQPRVTQAPAIVRPSAPRMSTPAAGGRPEFPTQRPTMVQTGRPMIDQDDED